MEDSEEKEANKSVRGFCYGTAKPKDILVPTEVTETRKKKKNKIYEQ